ncbi:MAG: glycoside hydrolase family 3 N-terminal domain-containing protein [Woeseia sp.]
MRSIAVQGVSNTLAAALVFAIAGTGIAGAQDAGRGTDQAVYRDADAAVERRVDDLLARMTLAEKIVQITTVWDSKTNLLDDDLQFDLEKIRQNYPDGIGQLARPSDASGPASPRVVPRRDPRATVELVNSIQKYATAETRLGIPVLFHEEGLHGYAALGATSFPQAIGLASSWDRDLVREVNSVIAREIRARGAHLVLSPVVDVARDARWGRFEETFGEDPFLVAEMGVAAVEGLQGNTGNSGLGLDRVFATLKHMTGHGQPESGTNIGPAPLSERELRENFFPPFEAVVRRTDIRSVMPSYNEIDGVPSHANGWLLTDVLRDEWGFDGVVVSDYYAIEQLADLHHIASNHKEAAVLALAAGVDVDLPDGRSYSHLDAALDEGLVSSAAIDAAVRRFLDLKFRSGLFEQPFADADHAEANTNSDEARELARKAAQRSIILLENRGVLPLSLSATDGSKSTIAVIGPSAAVARLGGYYGEPPLTVSILDGIRAKAGKRAGITFAEGVRITENDDWWADDVTLADPEENRRLIAEAVDVAEDADVLVLAIGDTEQTSREAWADAHLGDRSSLDLVGEQQELFDALKATGKPIVVILINGRPASTVAISEQADALIEGWYLGEQGGHAMADVLFGDVNPGGKLPVTIPRNVGQLPAFYNHKPSARRGYLFDTVEPLYPFGWGLSYTTFEIGEPELSADTIAAGGTVDVRVSIRNTGESSGDETLQLYVRDKVSSVTRPVKELRAFERVTLSPGERRTVTFRLDPGSFHFWNERMERVVEPGEFEIMVGPNSVELKSTTLTIGKSS